jgi:trehalose/maltose hydrolase-like predicted phosphorylase
MTPISPPPLRELQPGALPAYLSNGVIGLRVGVVPQRPSVAIVNGFAGVDPDSGAECFGQAPYPVSGDVEIDGVSVVHAVEATRLREQRYDFATGELHSSYAFDANGARGTVDVVTFCSRTMPTLVLQETTVSVDRACDLVLAAGVDHTGRPGSLVARHTRTRGSHEDPVDGSLLLESNGALGRCGAAYISELVGAEATPKYDEREVAPLSTRWAVRARRNARYRLRQITSLVPDTMHDQPDLQAVRLAYGGALRGFERVRDENRRAWEDVWRRRIRLVGAPERWQALVDAAFFYLHTSVHGSTPTSMSMFGLAYWPNYHYYRGHVMWDIEVFAVPPLILTHPDAARTLLEYRARHLEAAKFNAAMHGYRGAQYPWESGQRHGEESAPGEGAAAAREHHVSLDVAWAFAQYLHATHDWEWGRKHAWPVLSEVAEWTQSRGTLTDRGFEVHDVIGVAEREATVDNNAYINMAASIALREAAALAQPLGHEPTPAWGELARSVFVPVDRKGVIRNHDRYRVNEEKGETPEALAGLFPLGFDVPPRVERATLDFYLALADEYVGSPMLSSLLGVYAARTGDRARALELFERGYADFVIEPFSITTEYAPKVFPEQPVAGPFTANLGGFLMCLLYGLTGLRISDAEPESWCGLSVTLPSGWDAVEASVFARGARAELRAEHGAERGSLVLQESTFDGRPRAVRSLTRA